MSGVVVCEARRGRLTKRNTHSCEHRQWPEADAATKDATQLVGYSAAQF
jgi:hypothetical protein